MASLLIGVVQTFAVAIDWSLASLLTSLGSPVGEQTFGWPLLKLTISQVAPILPYLFLVLILIFRPKGLLGTREIDTMSSITKTTMTSTAAKGASGASGAAGAGATTASSRSTSAAS